MKQKVVILYLFLISCSSFGQSVTKTMLRLPDTGENTGYTSTFGEDADYNIYAPFFTINGNGTVTDTVTGLKWQSTDGGEMTVEDAIIYCDTLTLGGNTDWRLPNAHEAFSILNHQYNNPALDNTVFTPTGAEYWWTSDRQANDNNIVWVTNAGGGIGNHPKTETLSAGGTKKMHVRAVRDVSSPSTIPNHFTDNADGTILDNLTNLVWQKVAYADTLTWEQALSYAEALSLAGKSDWRLPNVKEMQSINDEGLIGPSVNTTFFSNIGVKKYWASTTLPNQTNQAWYFDTQFGIITHDLKTFKHNLLCVRGPQINTGVQDEYKAAISIKIFPNPANDKFTIVLPEGIKEDLKVSLINSLGHIIMLTRSNAIDISSIPNGIYLLTITTSTYVVNKDLIIFH